MTSSTPRGRFIAFLGLDCSNQCTSSQAQSVELGLRGVPFQRQVPAAKQLLGLLVNFNARQLRQAAGE